MLLELLSCKPNLHTAVEVTGGNQLFHIVVDNDTVATRIVDILSKGKLGRATFMPLNRMSPVDISYPDHGSEAVPMMKLLKFNAMFAPAVKQASTSDYIMMLHSNLLNRPLDLLLVRVRTKHLVAPVMPCEFAHLASLLVAVTCQHVSKLSPR